jgi:hypothetical protein
MTEHILLWSVKTSDKDSNSTYLDITREDDKFVLINAMETKVVKDNMVIAGISMTKEDLEELIHKLMLLLE